MALNDLRTFLDQPTLTLPVGGKKYTVQPCRADVWLRLQEIARRAEDDPTAEATPDTELFKLALGDDLYTKLLPLVTGPELRHIGTTAYLWQLGNHEFAARFWASGGKASTPAPKTPTRTRRATHTGEGTTTRRPASGSGTSTRKKS